MASYSNQKMTKQKSVQSLRRKLGQMSNKKKGKLSILQYSDRKMMQLITNWYYGIDKEEK